MADLTKIFTGMNAGPEAIQNNFEKVNQAVENMGGELSQLQWSKTSCAGVVGSNGWEVLKEDRGSGYQILNIGGLRLIWLHLLIKKTSDFSGSASGWVVTLPSNVQPAVYGIAGSLDDPSATWYYWDGAHAISLNATTTSFKWEKDHIYPISVIYIGKNN